MTPWTYHRIVWCIGKNWKEYALIRTAIGTLALVSAMPATAQNQGTEVAVKALVERFETARERHDPATLAATLAPDYEEISPIGDVDSRSEVLGFYAPELKRPVPVMAQDQVAVRTTGDVTVVTLRKSFTLPGAAPRSVRVRYVAQRQKRGWLLLSAQYTPIPPRRPS